MEKSIRRFTRIGCAVGVGMVISYCQVVRAGWSVNVNATTGQGTVTVRVTSATGVLTTQTTPFMVNPSAAINKRTNILFAREGLLPSGANSGTYVQVRAFPFYRTTIEQATVGGDLNDDPDLLPFVIPKSACATASVEIEPIQTTANSITFQYRAKLSDEGSAVLLKVVDNTTLQQKYVVMLVGPYDNTDTNSCEGTITVTGNLADLNLVLDGHTSTLPFSITCPPDSVLGCSSALPETYDPPAVATGETGPFTISYDKLPSQLAIGVTNIVTATATDTNGCTVHCQFKVYRQAIDFEGFFPPVGGADGPECQAVRSFRLGSNVALKFKMTCDGQDVTSGIPVITIERCGGNVVFQGPFQHVNNEWHFNVDSTIIGTNPSAAGTYKFTATLPDGSQHSTVLQFTKK